MGAKGKKKMTKKKLKGFYHKNNNNNNTNTITTTTTNNSSNSNSNKKGDKKQKKKTNYYITNSNNNANKDNNDKTTVVKTDEEKTEKPVEIKLCCDKVLSLQDLHNFIINLRCEKDIMPHPAYQVKVNKDINNLIIVVIPNLSSFHIKDIASSNIFSEIQKKKNFKPLQSEIGLRKNCGNILYKLLAVNILKYERHDSSTRSSVNSIGIGENQEGKEQNKQKKQHEQCATHFDINKYLLTEEQLINNKYPIDEKEYIFLENVEYKRWEREIHDMRKYLSTTMNSTEVIKIDKKEFSDNKNLNGNCYIKEKIQEKKEIYQSEEGGKCENEEKRTKNDKEKENKKENGETVKLVGLENGTVHPLTGRQKEKKLFTEEHIFEYAKLINKLVKFSKESLLSGYSDDVNKMEKSSKEVRTKRESEEYMDEGRRENVEEKVKEEIGNDKNIEDDEDNEDNEEEKEKEESKKTREENEEEEKGDNSNHDLSYEVIGKEENGNISVVQEKNRKRKRVHMVEKEAEEQIQEKEKKDGETEGNVTGTISLPYRKKKDKIIPLKFDLDNVFSIDCEMCQTINLQKELTKVTVVDAYMNVVYDSYVVPDNQITNYLTMYSGIDADTLKGVTTKLEDVQKHLKKILNKYSILIGHSLENDLHALKMNHSYVIDTSIVYSYYNNYYHKPSLFFLAKKHLNITMNRDQGHDSVDDAKISMFLALKKIAELKNGTFFMYTYPLGSLLDKENIIGNDDNLICQHNVNENKKKTLCIFDSNNTFIEEKLPSYFLKNSYHCVCENDEDCVDSLIWNIKKNETIKNHVVILRDYENLCNEKIYDCIKNVNNEDFAVEQNEQIYGIPTRVETEKILNKLSNNIKKMYIHMDSNDVMLVLSFNDNNLAEEKLRESAFFSKEIFLGKLDLDEKINAINEKISILKEVINRNKTKGYYVCDRFYEFLQLLYTYDIHVLKYLDQNKSVEQHMFILNLLNNLKNNVTLNGKNRNNGWFSILLK